MNLGLAIAILSLMVAANYWMFRSVLYPPFIFCAMWLLDLAVYRTGFIDIDPLHRNTLLFITAGAFLFSAAGALTRLMPEYLLLTRFSLSPSVIRSRAPKYFLLLLFASTIPFVVHDRIQKAAEGAGTSFVERSRNASIEEAEQGGSATAYIVNSIAPLAIVMVLLFSFEEHNWSYWAALAFAVFVNLLGGGRTGLLTLILSVTGIHLVRSRKERFLAAIRVARWPFLIFVAIFIGIVFISKDTSSFDGVGGLLGFFVVGYLIGPTVALDYVVQRPSDFAAANHTFQFLLKPAAALHLLPYTPPPVFDNFILVPFPTNVYTVYRFYLTEFGVYGCLALIALIGFLHSLLYRRAHQRGRLSLILFALSLFPVVMVVFDDLYFAVAFYLRVVILCLAYWAVAGIDWRILPARSDTRTTGAL
jgi:oligosaccharide repeat unit polymerase